MPVAKALAEVQNTHSKKRRKKGILFPLSVIQIQMTIIVQTL